MQSTTADTDAFVRSLNELASDLASVFGQSTEIVVHDFRGGSDGTIVAIFGNLTERSVGGSMSQLGLGLLRDGREAQDCHNYVTKTKRGRTLKCTTLVLRDHQGDVFGAFCINIDVTDVRRAAQILGEMAGLENSDSPAVEFSNDPTDVVRSIIAQEVAALGVPVSHLTREGREGLVQTLDARGVFVMQKGVPIAAEELGVSRTTIYNYINLVQERRTKR